MKKFLKILILKLLGPVIKHIKDGNEELKSILIEKLDRDTRSCTNGILQIHLYNFYRSSIKNGSNFNINETGFRNFSQFEEDGLILYVLAVIGIKHRTFVDIGSANGVNSNCANLAINFGFHGLFIDGNKENIQQGRAFYAHHPDTSLFPPIFVNSFVQKENINQIIEENDFKEEIDVLSIDIDGNDYWIWEALEIIRPRVVIIETHIELGEDSIVVPYDKNHSYPNEDNPDYFGASGRAMCNLAKRKGYRLVGSNKYGFNTIFVKEKEGEKELPTIPVESLFKHPRYTNRKKLENMVLSEEFINV
jgi:hypothetical protein